ncbi:MAG: sugar phosphate isomerase/epimerase family protein [Spirochaetota bacterium]
MRLGAPLQSSFDSPEAWIAALRAKGYRAAYSPLPLDASAAQRTEYRQAAAEADIVIAEVGAWSNPLSRDRQTADAALRKMVDALRLADDLGARCSVNIAGSRGEKWDGPDAGDLTEETFSAIVEMCRKVIDEASPQTAHLSLEPMPWMYPESAESYARLLTQVDHPRFGVHYDPVNLINSPPKYFASAREVDHFVDLLGPQIVSVHVKDIVLGNQLTTHLDECIPGTGGFDIAHLFERLDRLEPDLPVMLEHLPTEAEYDQAAAHVRAVAEALGVKL